MNKLLRAGFRTTLTSLVMGSSAGVALWLSLGSAANALPGQTVDEAKAWMQAHPTLRATPRERLSIRRNNTASRRYTFHGSLMGPGQTNDVGLMLTRDSETPVVVRSEKFTLVDVISGVSIERLEDSLRMLYGAEVYADYRRSQAVLVYSPGRSEDRGTERAQRSQLLEGDLYAYLIELLPNEDGTVETGAVSVMLKEDVPAYREAVRSREIERREFEHPAGPSHTPVRDRLLGNQ
ncbi:MAG: hypothetical protein AAF171_13500 [Cyanobacteria bacterium P01_A01_bin.116]